MSDLISKKRPLTIVVDDLPCGMYTDVDSFLIEFDSQVSSSKVAIKNIIINTLYGDDGFDIFDMAKMGKMYDYKFEVALNDILSKNPTSIRIYIFLEGKYRQIEAFSPSRHKDTEENVPLRKFIQKSYE
jgi:hypothetical protein